MTILIADIAGMLGMGFFLTATIAQWRKIHKTGHTTAISLCHYKLKIVAIICALTCFLLSDLWLSFSVVAIELFVSIHITQMLIRYRKVKIKEKKADEYYESAQKFVKDTKKR